ncbi:sensor histidine kinase [Streptodolium elevatio]|uniref:histidine kinase n=1 Tax=Streptodolium elevatio TaxID=3157996 RepID=A0ABV3DW65_9ACTN
MSSAANVSDGRPDGPPPTHPGAHPDSHPGSNPGHPGNPFKGTNPFKGANPFTSAGPDGMRPGARTIVLRLLREPTRLRSLREAWYFVAVFPLTFVLLILFGVGFMVSVPLSITVVGLPLLAAIVLLGRYQGGLHRGIARLLLREDVEGPRPFHRRPGAFGWLGSSLGHLEGWRGVLFLGVRLPIAVIGFAATWLLWGMGLMFLTYPIWMKPTQLGDHGDGAGVTLGDNLMGSWYELIAVGLFGVLLLLVAPWAVRLIARADLWLMRALLGPTKLSERVRDLEETRAIAVDDSAARLRRIERDLHDGAQARIVALAMHLSQAQERLDVDHGKTDGGSVDLAKARAHVDSALGNARIAITELRDLARGIHPPVLDQGLDAALATLASGSAISVGLRTDIDRRPPAALESIAYFCAAELMANAGRHSDATEILMDAERRGDTLVVRVEDNGRGGARIREGGGLAGLAERVRTVDGTLRVDSPPGGPTRITVELPVAEA